MNGSEFQLPPELIFAPEQVLANMPLPMKACGALLFSSFQALLFFVLSVGLAVMLWRLFRRYRFLLSAVGEIASDKPVSRLGQERSSGGFHGRNARV